MNMEGSISVGRKQPAVDREVIATRQSCGRYLEELDTCSSPGVVSKKAAFFEEAIRSASGEKCSLRATTGASRIDETEVEYLRDGTARTLDFSSDCNEVENRPPQVNKQQHGAVEKEVLSEAAKMEKEGLVQEVKLDETFAAQIPLPEEIKLDVTESTQHEEAKVEDEAEESDGVVTDEAVAASVEEAKDHEEQEGENSQSSAEEASELTAKIQEATTSQQPSQEVIETKYKGNASAMSQKGKLHVGSTAPGKPKARSETAVRNSISEFISKKIASRSVHPLSKSTSFTSPRPFTLATEKRKTNEGRSTNEESKAKARSNQTASLSLRKTQPSKDSRAVAAPRRSVSEFHLKSEERAEKRKEFYSKLEERMIGKEEEKNQMKARSQEDMETELRKLRQSLAFKAKPMPSFYHHQSPHTKNELRKAPTTRPISPKLGRPRSSDASASNHHHVRLCQQQRQTSINGRRSTTGNGTVGAESFKAPDALLVNESFSCTQVAEDDCSLLDLSKEEDDETLLFAGSIAEVPSSFQQQQQQQQQPQP